MSAEELCLSWDEHHKTLIGVFEKLLENSTLVDCTIAAEGQYLKAHKVVLSACSPYFEMLFTQENEKNPIVVLKDVKFQDLKALIDFIYRGRVQIPGERLSDFTSAAECLQIKGLGGGQKRNFSEGVDRASVSQCVKDGSDSSPSLKRMRRNFSDVKHAAESLTSVPLISRGCERIPDLPSCSTSACSSTFEKTYSAPSHSVRTHEESNEKIPSFTEEQMDCVGETKLEPISEVMLPESECLVEPKTEVCEEISILGSDDEVDDALQSWNNEESNNSVYSSPHGSMKEVSDNSFSGTLMAEQSNAALALGTLGALCESAPALERRLPPPPPAAGVCCGECGLDLPSAAALRAHRLQAHRGERRFPCGECGRAFFTRGDLGVHRRIHTGERPFHCHYCAATFRKSSGFHRHVRALHAGLPAPRARKRPP